MLSLYKIYNNIILESEPESDNPRRINSPTDNDFIDAIKSFNMYRVRYSDKHGNPEPKDRNVQFYVFGYLNGKNHTKAVRVFQNGGYTTSKNVIWKTFDTSKIVSMEKTGMHMGYLPVTAGSDLVQYKQYNDKSFSHIIYQKRFDNMPDMSNLPPKQRKQNSEPRLVVNKSDLLKPLRKKEKENNKRRTSYNDTGRETNY